MPSVRPQEVTTSWALGTPAVENCCKIDFSTFWATLGRKNFFLSENRKFLPPALLSITSTAHFGVIKSTLRDFFFLFCFLLVANFFFVLCVVCCVINLWAEHKLNLRMDPRPAPSPLNRDGFVIKVMRVWRKFFGFECGTHVTTGEVLPLWQ